MTAVQPSHPMCSKVTPGDYLFYHTIDLPGLGEMPGEWDLRSNPDEYLGNTILTNKQVLDLGTANGFLTFHMESKGASVVSYDVSPHDDWDIIPHASREDATLAYDRRNRLRKINNAYRLSHRLLNSRARLVRGTVFAIPDLVGLVDITLAGYVLLHGSNPFLALRQAARITRETIVITGILANTRQRLLHRLFGRLGATTERKIRHGLLGLFRLFRPAAVTSRCEETGGHPTPEQLEKFLPVLGFKAIRISYHRQQFTQQNKAIPMYTLVANRTVPMRFV